MPRTVKKERPNFVHMHKMFMCGGRTRFPTISVLLLVVGVLWLLSELGVITVSIPWWPVILIIIALGWLVNHYANR